MSVSDPDPKLTVPPSLRMERARPQPVFVILSYLLPAVVAIFGLHRGFSLPSSEFSFLVGFAYGCFGLAGGAVLGIALSMIALSRGEAQGAKSLILLPVILGGVAVLAGGLWFFGIL
jgi:hypothetical protein